METLAQLMGLIGFGLILVGLIYGIKRNPAMFSGTVMNQAFRTMGLLALGLIALVIFLVQWVRS